MSMVVEGLADLSSLRDREALDFALVALIDRCEPGLLLDIALLRLVGEAPDLRWQLCARVRDGQPMPDRDRGWVDWGGLPPLAQYPDRLRCLDTGAVLVPAEAPCTCLFPIGLDGKSDGLLEVSSSLPLPAGSKALIVAVLRLYRNVQGLLDYGEKDGLTELLNRKTFDGAFLKASLYQQAASMDGQADRRQKSQGGYWLAVLDIDHFKRVNDQFGHLIGDEVLLLTARLMRSSFRLHDQLYRFGGEEFVILMRCGDDADAYKALERFRLRIESHDFPQVGHITVSIGFAPVHADDTPSSGFDRADKCVYHAKSHGRNQVCGYTFLLANGLIQAEPTVSQEVDFF